jgi:hypothetical protein
MAADNDKSVTAGVARDPAIRRPVGLLTYSAGRRRPLAHLIVRSDLLGRTMATDKRPNAFVRASVAALAVGASLAAVPGIASADATDDYPIPNRMLKTTCTVDQYMAAARDVEPIYYERYMIDYNNRPVDVEDAARDRIYWFFSLDYAGRRQYSEDTATNVYYEQMATHWGNWAKLFFNNKGVVARSTDICAQYQPSDPSVWNWGPNQRPDSP